MVSWVGLGSILVGSLCGCAALGRGMGPSREEQRPFFEAEALTGVGDRGQSVATLSVSIPYRNLVFFREAQGYASSYRIRAVQVDSRGPRHLREWTGRVEVPDYASTRASKVARTTMSLDLADLEARDPERPPHLEVTVEIDRSSRRARRDLPLRLSSIRDGKLTVGELALYRKREAFTAMPTDVEVMGRALPDPELFRRQADGRFDVSTGEPWLFVRVFDLREDSTDSIFTLHLRVTPAGADTARFVRDLDLSRQGYVTSVLLRLPTRAFAHGLNDLDVVVDGAKEVSTTLVNAGLDLTNDASWKSVLIPVKEIATDEEYARLRAAKVSERDGLWWEFWDRRDPDPTTSVNEALVEHFHRVRYVREKLVDGFGDGVLSDRGRVYIRLGAPDSIEEGNSRYDSFASYQVWRYREVGLVYYFQDSTGTGNYRLVWWEED